MQKSCAKVHIFATTFATARERALASLKWLWAGASYEFSEPCGLSITNFQVPSLWRRTTSARRPPIVIGLPSGSEPVMLQVERVRAKLPSPLCTASTFIVKRGFSARKPFISSRIAACPVTTSPESCTNAFTSRAEVAVVARRAAFLTSASWRWTGTFFRMWREPLQNGTARIHGLQTGQFRTKTS